MTARLIVLLAASSAGALAQYVYDSTDTWQTTVSSRWQQNGSFAFNSGNHLTFSGGSLIDTVPISGSNSSDYEVKTTLSIKAGGGTFIHFLRASSSSVQVGVGSYISVEIAIPSPFQGYATLTVNQCENGVVSQLGTAAFAVADGMTVRSVVFGPTLWVYFNDIGKWGQWVPQWTGNPGIGGSGQPAGNGFTTTALGHHDTVAPGTVVGTTVASSVYPTSAALKWQGVVDDANGIGLKAYVVQRNGTVIETGLTPEFVDATVQPSTTYTYAIQAVDYHGNMSTATAVAVTTPPAGAIDPRRVGLTGTGSYWGGGGEQIDTMSGNLHFGLPLLTAMGRTGWSVPVGLIYDSQNWRRDNGVDWQLTGDVGLGFGWRMLAGSVTPYYTNWYYTVDHYVYTDSSGAEYRLDVNSNGVWSSTQGVYVWFDANNNLMHFKDGSLWVMGCTSGGTEPDAGTMYPTIIEDSNGNQILMTYGAGSGLPGIAINTSARIATIEDVRGKGAATYTFNYSNLHLSTIANSINTAETYTFTYSSGQLAPPFGADSTYAGLTKTSLATVQGATSSQWIFAYDTAGAGELMQAQFPDGGHLRWVYQAGQYNGSRQLREITSRYVSPAAGAPEWAPYTFAFDNAVNQTIHATMTLTDASGVGAKTWNFIQPGLPANAWQVGLASDFYQKVSAAGAVLTHDNYTWARNASNNPLMTTKTTVMDEGTTYAKSSSVSMASDSYGNATSQVGHDYAGGMRTSTNAWLHTQNSSYDTAYIRNRVTSATLTDGSNSLPASTISYDAGTLSAATGTPTEFDSTQGATTNHMRGNATQQISLGVAVNFTYDQTGSTTSGTNAGGTGASVVYNSTTNFGAPSALTPVAGTADVQNGHTPAQTAGSQLATGATYTAALALAQSSMPNGATTSQTFSPTTGLLTQSVSVHGAATNYTYTFNPTTVTATTNSHWMKTYKDGFSRDVAVETGYGSTIVSHVANVYGPCACSPLGKLVKTSAPYAIGAGGAITASDGTATIAWTTYTYDGLGRTAAMTAADGSVTSYLYQGNTTKTTDPAGNWKRYTNDVWGHLTKVEEPNPADGQADNAATNLITNYTYDLEDHLTQVSMPRGGNTQTRTFTYDLPSAHLVSATNPESGTVSYAYYSSGRLQSKTDNAGQKTMYSYDGYGRLAYIDRYPDGMTPDWCHATALTYDAGASGSNAVGRIAGAVFGDPSCASGKVVSEGYSYTTGGLVTGKGYSIQVPTTSINYGTVYYLGYSYGPQESYTWDNEGHMTGYGTFAYTLDAMGRQTGLTETGPGTAWVQNAGYGPAGETKTMQYRTGGGAYYTENRTFNNRTQLTQLQTSGTGLTGINLKYSYAGGSNNGQISQMTDVLSGEQITYTYDALKRLAKAETTQSQVHYPNASWWGQSFGYDGFGNLLTKAATAGHTATALSVGVDPATNHVSGLGYDLNGNVTSIPAYPQNITLGYDMDNRTGGTIYDVENQPLDRGGQWNLYGLNGERLGTFTYTTQQNLTIIGGIFYYNQWAVQTQTSRNIYFGGRLIQSNGSSVATDRTGSVRATEGGVVSEYYPYGEEIVHTADGREKFGTYTRESSGALAGLDYANQRYYSSTYGTFTSPDRYEGSSAPGNPLSWNRYAYVHGDPINLRDPTGRIRENNAAPSEDCFGDDGGADCNPLCWAGGNFLCYWNGSGGGGTGGGGSSHPEPPAPPSQPSCSISLYERPVGVPVVGLLADHTYLLIQDATRSTVEGGPDLIDIPLGYLIGIVSTPPGKGLDGTDPTLSSNKQVGPTYSGTGACDYATTIFLTESRYNTSGAWAKYDPSARLGYNSNSFTFTLLGDVGLSKYFGEPDRWAPGWGQFVPGLR